LSGETANRIQQINFQAQSESYDNGASDTSAYDEIPQYVDYEPDDEQDGDVHYDSSRDFNAPYGSDMMHNVIEHPSIVNPSPLSTPLLIVEPPSKYYHIHRCSTCTAEFFSKNRLFKHLREYQHFQKSQSDDSHDAVAFHTSAEADVLKSMSTPVSGARLSFWSYNFTEIQISFNDNSFFFCISYYVAERHSNPWSRRPSPSRKSVCRFE